MVIHCLKNSPVQLEQHFISIVTGSLNNFMLTFGNNLESVLTEFKSLLIIVDWIALSVAFSALMLLVGWQEGHLACKNWVVGCWCGYLGWGADLHMAQQMPLPLTISCSNSNKSRLVLPSWFLPFWYLLTRVVPDKFQKSSKTIVCYVCVALSFCMCVNQEVPWFCMYCAI